MGKLKTKSSVKKRFSITARGKVKMKKASLRHLLSVKNASRKMRLRHPKMLENVMAKHIKKLLPYN